MADRKSLRGEITPREEWKDILGFEGLYKVSNRGQVASYDRVAPYKKTNYTKRIRGKVLSLKTSNKGYLECILTKNKRKYSCRVHRLVAMVFIPNPNNYPYINHVNEDKKDNRVENLEWCTPKQNVEMWHKNRMCLYQYEIDGTFVKKWNSLTEAALQYGGGKGGIQHCCAGKLKTYRGYIWSYNKLNNEDLLKRTEDKNRKAVLQCSMNGDVINEFKSYTEAAKSVGCNPSAISMACSGLRKTIKGYIWKEKV